MSMYKLILGDCLEKLKLLKDKCIDLVLIDPPYNIGKDTWDKWETLEDYVNFMGQVFLECQRVLKDSGSFYFFHNDFLQIVELQNFINKNTKFVFKQLITWNKIHEDFKNYGHVQHRLSVNTMKNYYNGFTEYCLYYTLQDTSILNDTFKSLKDYAKELRKFIGLTYNDMNEILGHRKVEHFFYHSAIQWKLCTEEAYNQLIEVFNIDKYEGFKTYDELKKEYEKLEYTFNNCIVKENPRGNSNVWLYPPAKKQGHITPKPVDLLEHIIKTSSNEGDVVLDCFMGSGSTGVACLNTNRYFIGIEIDEKYFEITKNRLENLKKE